MDDVRTWLRGEPPARIAGRTLTLRRWHDDDREAQAAAILESTAALSAWMPWADGYDTRASREFLARAQAEWDARTAFAYGIWSPDGPLLGAVGLHARIGVGGLDMGYWVRSGAIRRGHATRAVALATATALGVDGVTHVEIHHDRANEISGRIPARLGYRHVATVGRERGAPAASGVALHWRMTADDYDGSPAARLVFETVAGDAGSAG